MGERVTKLFHWTIGIAASGLITYFLLTEGRESLPILLASIFLLLAVGTDTALSKIPNFLTLTCLLAGLGYHVAQTGAAGFLDSALGVATGLGLLLLPYALGGMGGGDVKALAALGALLGPGGTFQVFLYMGLIGGGIALAHYVVDRRLRHKVRAFWTTVKTFFLTRRLRDVSPKALAPGEGKDAVKFPYAAALAFGFYAYSCWGGLV